MRWRERFDATTSAIALPAVLLVAFGVRAVHVTAGLPHAIGIDEPAIVERAPRILNTGDWNPHVFDYPTLVIYAHALLAIAVFLGGAAAGAWASLEAFDVVAVYTASRLLTAAISLATVLLTYRIADAIGGRALGLLAAAQLAVLSMHVRESHFALTDVPLTALTTLAIWFGNCKFLVTLWRSRSSNPSVRPVDRPESAGGRCGRFCWPRICSDGSTAKTRVDNRRRRGRVVRAVTVDRPCCRKAVGQMVETCTLIRPSGSGSSVWSCA